MAKKHAKTTAGTEARRVAVSTRQLVLHEAGYKCANPRCRYPLTLDVHHLLYVSGGGGNAAENLLPLCPTCHTEHHNGNIPMESLRAWKMLLLALNEAFDRRSIDLLLTIDGLNEVTRISGDGVIDYAPLIASGLVSMQSNWHQLTTGFGGQTEIYVARLTEKGRLFIEGWKKGDQRFAIELASKGSLP